MTSTGEMARQRSSRPDDTTVIEARSTERARPSAAAIWVALGVVYVVWGSTYLAIRVVVEDMPPLLSASARFAVASIVMAIFVSIRFGPKVLRVRPRELGSAALVGVLVGVQAYCFPGVVP